MTRCDRAGSFEDRSSGNADGTTCHERPYVSFSHPHGPGCPPPAVSFSQKSSISCWVSHVIANETASVNLNCGPPLSATKRCPSSSNVAVIADPFGPGPASPYRVTLRIFAFLNTDT